MWHVPPGLNRSPNSSTRFHNPTDLNSPPPVPLTATITTMGLGDLHHTTPKKAKILGTIHYLRTHNLPFHTIDVFRHNQVSKTRLANCARRRW